MNQIYLRRGMYAVGFDTLPYVLRETEGAVNAVFDFKRWSKNDCVFAFLHI